MALSIMAILGDCIGAIICISLKNSRLDWNIHKPKRNTVWKVSTFFMNNSDYVKLRLNSGIIPFL